MKYMLMHKIIPVCKVELDETTGSIRRIVETLCPKHLPIGVSAKKGIADRAALNRWWLERSIPATRSGDSMGIRRTGTYEYKATTGKMLRIKPLRPILDETREQYCFLAGN